MCLLHQNNRVWFGEMALAVNTYIKLALCVTLLLGVECRVIKIEEDGGGSSDFTAKILIKYEKRDILPKLRHKEHMRPEIVYSLEHKNMNTKTDDPPETNDYDDIDSFKSVMPKSSLPDNLFEENSEQNEARSMGWSHYNPALEPIPDFTPRVGINYGYCPQGHIRLGNDCFPNSN
ncbi:unnamed protein product, partial [Iphiclides podalirius]